MLEEILARIAALRPELIALQGELVRRPALGPTNGGEGEKDKADFLKDWLRSRPGIRVTDLPAPDPRVPCGSRPNLAAVLPGRDETRTLWIIGHMDVVPPGDEALWTTPPFILQVDGERMIGRGTEDNHQGIISALLLVQALLDKGAG